MKPVYTIGWRVKMRWIVLSIFSTFLRIQANPYPTIMVIPDDQAVAPNHVNRILRSSLPDLGSFNTRDYDDAPLRVVHQSEVEPRGGNGNGDGESTLTLSWPESPPQGLPLMSNKILMGSVSPKPDCNRLCPFGMHPICGSDGMTYSSLCEMSQQNCAFPNDPAVTLVHDGKCSNF